MWERLACRGLQAPGVTLVFPRGLIWIVAGIRIEHGLVESLIVVDRIHKALGLHISVEVASESVGCHHGLHWAVIVVDLFLEVALFVHGIAPGVALFDG